MRLIPKDHKTTTTKQTNKNPQKAKKSPTSSPQCLQIPGVHFAFQLGLGTTAVIDGYLISSKHSTNVI
jgi:hypothetical protein